MQGLAYTLDVYAIMAQCKDTLRFFYSHYFKQEVMNSPAGHCGRQASLNSCVQFCTDLGVCPYFVSRKVVWYVWESVVACQGNSLGLTQDPENVQITPLTLGSYFTIREFTVFVYRLCVYLFDCKYRNSSANIVIKLLSSLAWLDKQPG